MAVTVRSATAEDVPALAAFGQQTMGGRWRCALSGEPHPDRLALEHFISGPEADRFDVILGEVGGTVHAYAVLEKANQQIRWLLGDEPRKAAGTAIMRETKRRYPKSWGRVENPDVRAWASSLLPSMTVHGDRIDL